MVRRSEGHVCGDLRTEFYECSELAHRTYVEDMKLGDDGRPDFRFARTSCGNMAAIQKRR